MSQALDLLGEPIGEERLDGLHNPGMQCAPTVLEHAPVGHLVGEGVLKRVLEIREDARLVVGIWAAWRSVSPRRRLSSGTSAMACRSVNGTAFPMTEAA